MFGKLFYQKYIFSTSFTPVGVKYLSLPAQYLKRIFSDFLFNINHETFEYKQIKCSVDICGITYLIFLISTEYLKGLCVIILNFKVEIRDVYIFAIFFSSAQWSKITELGYRCATTVSFKVAYVV